MQVENAAQFTAVASKTGLPRRNCWICRCAFTAWKRGAIQVTGEDGSGRMRTFVRKVEWGDSYTVLNHLRWMISRPEP